ncbi:hypothetical protein [Aquimarina rubra]|uniref:Phage holin family protein n=1 Tax=Aquimarina rubra TaxID=1920033 RepID=A0ABW5LNW0_9FLAO
MNQEEPEDFTGQTFDTPLYINGNLETNPQISIPRIPFLLERYDFDKIIKRESFWLNIANTLLGAVIALFINMIAKLLGNKINSEIPFDEWEVYAFLIALILMIISYCINRFVPNEKRRIVKKIKDHFENS